MEDNGKSTGVESILGNPVDYKMLVKYSVDKDVAERLLSKNYAGQRTVKSRAVSEYASDMRSGNWDQNIGSYIAVGPDGTLYDGQHRLLAVVESGVTVDMWFDTESGNEQFPFFDNGTKRGVKDYATGFGDAPAVSAIAKLIVCAKDGKAPLTSVVHGYFDSRHAPTRQQVLKVIEEDADILVDLSHKGARLKKGIGFGGVSIYGFFVWFMSWIGDDYRLNDFIDQMGMTVPNSPSVFYTQKTLVKNRVAYKDKPTLFGALLHSFKAFRTNPDAPLSLNKQKHYLDEYDRILKAKRALEGNRPTV